MELIALTQGDLESGHICCTISSSKDCQVLPKEAWLKERLSEGLMFVKYNARGRCFIEHIPAEAAWMPVEADGYIYIGCLWVSGQFKGQGYPSLLLEEYIRSSKEKGRKGLVVPSLKKKMGFLFDPEFLKHKGLETVDRAGALFELMALPLWEQGEKPRSRPQMKDGIFIPGKGLVLYYTSQCPFAARYVPVLEETTRRRDAEMKTIHIRTAKQVQDAPLSSTAFSLLHNGELVAHEILSEKKFEKILDMC